MKYVFYVIGIFILTCGISLTIQSNLGTSPFDALLVGLSQNIGLTVGSWEFILAIILILFNSLLKRQQPEALGLVTAFITGIGIDLWLFLLHGLITPEIWYSQLICFISGLIVIGFGTAIYLHTNFAPIPVDRLTLIIQELTNTTIFLSRTFIYLVFLIIAFSLDGPIGIGTLLTVCLGGLVLQYFMPAAKKVLNRFIADSNPSTHDKKQAI